MDKVERRDRPKSLGRTRGATLGTAVKALFGPYRSPHNDRIHLRSLAQTPFRTVSEGEFSEVRSNGGLRSSRTSLSRCQMDDAFAIYLFPLGYLVAGRLWLG